MSLPSGYKRLEYIQSTGTQYIDTGFVPNQDTRVYAECVLPISAGSTQALFGSRVSSSARQYQFVTQGGYYRSDYNTTINNFTKHDYGTAKFYVDKNKNITDLNKEYSATQTYGSFTCPGNMYIFATNNNGGLYGYSKAKLYKLTIYDNGKLARDFIPCKTASGVIGLYDLVGAKFYGNKGSGAFTAGPEVHTKPDAPTGLTATVKLDIVSLSWTAAAGAIGYRISRGSAELADQGGTTYQDTVPETGQSYVYTVIAYNEAGDSNPATLTVTVPYAPSAQPAAPTGLTANVTLSTAQLTWTASNEADGYRVRRNGTQIVDTADTQYLDTGLTRGQTYTYTVAGYNVLGEGAAASITATPELTLITDRTAEDVAQKTAKGFYNATDLNRVGAAVEYIAGRFTALGYACPVTVKKDWLTSNAPTASQMEAYRQNIVTLRSRIAVMQSTPEAPASMAGLNYVKANNIEQILLDLDALIDKLIKSWCFSGELYAGEV